MDVKLGKTATQRGAVAAARHCAVLLCTPRCSGAPRRSLVVLLQPALHVTTGVQGLREQRCSGGSGALYKPRSGHRHSEHAVSTSSTRHEIPPTSSRSTYRVSTANQCQLSTTNNCQSSRNSKIIQPLLNDQMQPQPSPHFLFQHWLLSLVTRVSSSMVASEVLGASVEVAEASRTMMVSLPTLEVLAMVTASRRTSPAPLGRTTPYTQRFRRLLLSVTVK